MNRHFFTIRAASLAACLIALAVSWPTKFRPATATGHTMAVHESYGNLPMSFQANRGQADSAVQFTAQGKGYSLSLTATEAVMDFRPGGKAPAQTGRPHSPRARLRMRWLNANRNARLSGAEKLPGSMSYFLGDDSRQWRVDVPSYAKVRYAKLYPGIDLQFYGDRQKLEYDLVLSPGADPRAIGLQFAGARAIRLEADGDLMIATEMGELRQHRPVAYQEFNGQKHEVASRFVLTGQIVKFALGEYDTSRPLVIDPVLGFSTLLGGALLDSPEAVAVDAQGNVFVTGWTYYRDLRGTGAEFPSTPGAIRSTGTAPLDNGTYIFISKLNPSGTALLYSAIIGGTKGFPEPATGADLENRSYGIAVDETGAAYVTGFTHSLNFPTTPGVVQPDSSATFTIDEAFVLKLAPAGNALSYSTLLGEGDAGGQAIAVDRSGQAWVTGYARNRKFPTTANALQRTPQNANTAAFVAKLNPSADRLLYASYLSSGSQDIGVGIALDAIGAAYVAGWTSSSCLRPDLPPVAPFPTTEGAFQRDASGGCTPAGTTSYAFVAKFTADGAVVYSTLIRGASANAIAVDASGAAYIAGKRIGGLPFPVTSGALQPQPPAGQLSQSGFVTKLNPAGNGLIYSTYFSGSVGLFGNLKLAVDGTGRACLAGAVSDSTFVATVQDAPFSTRRGAFVTRFKADGSALDYSVVLGDTYTGGRAIAIGPDDQVYVIGTTTSATFPTTAGAFQQQLAGDYDAFVLKLASAPPLVSVSAASYLGTALASDSIVAAFGRGMGLDIQIADSAPLPTTLAGVTVGLNDALGIEHHAQLFFISPDQINYLIPPAVASGGATVTVSRDGVAVSSGSLLIAPVAPGLFTANSNGRGAPAALALYIKPDGSQRYDSAARYDEANHTFVPAPIDVCGGGEDAYLILFGTGLRRRSSLGAVSVTVAGENAPVIYAGEQGGFAGLDQINVLLPRSLCGRGEAEVVLTVDGKSANPVMVFFQ